MQGRSPLGGLCGCTLLLLSRMLSLGLPLSSPLFGGFPFSLGLLDSFLGLLAFVSLSVFLLAFGLCFFLFLLLLGFVPLHPLVERVHVASCLVKHVMWVEQFNRRRTEGACGQD